MQATFESAADLAAALTSQGQVILSDPFGLGAALQQLDHSRCRRVVAAIATARRCFPAPMLGDEAVPRARRRRLTEDGHAAAVAAPRELGEGTPL